MGEAQTPRSFRDVVESLLENAKEQLSSYDELAPALVLIGTGIHIRIDVSSVDDEAAHEIARDIILKTPGVSCALMVGVAHAISSSGAPAGTREEAQLFIAVAATHRTEGDLIVHTNFKRRRAGHFVFDPPKWSKRPNVGRVLRGLWEPRHLNS